MSSSATDASTEAPQPAPGAVNSAFSRQASLPGRLRQGGSRSGSPSPFVALSSSLASSTSSLPEVPTPEVPSSTFHATVDQIKSDHFASAREAIKDEELLEDLLEEIERDCEGLRNFLYAAQVCRSVC
jgi:aspartate kinase